jgi:hypothetical protein
MSVVRQVTPGTTRSCPHCRTTILESAAICPACRHHLRFAAGAARRPVPSFESLRVEGTIRHPPVGEPWEYSMTLSIRNDRGEEIARQIVGVGALQPEESRTFTLAVEVFTPGGAERPGNAAPEPGT